MKQILITTIILILLAGSCFAQESSKQFQTAYESALLDSAYRYELLKPTFFNLKTAYEYRGKEVEDLRNTIRLSSLQSEIQKKEYLDGLRSERKREKKKLRAGLAIGTAFGIVAAILIR